MPVKNCTIENQSGYKWGDNGTCYPYKEDSNISRLLARDKAIKQGKAIEVSKQNHSIEIFDKISFDYDGVLSTDKGKELVKEKIKNGDEVYIITGRMENDNNDSLFNIAKELGIDRNHIYFTNHKDKWEEIKRIGIDIHYDNNPKQIEKIKDNTEAKGILFNNG